MNQADDITDEAILRSWYHYAAEQVGFVGNALFLLRDRLGKSVQKQQEEFGADDDQFLQLQAMPLPRATAFTSDAHRIAEVRRLQNPFAFVQAMVLARSMRNVPAWLSGQEAYQAAFDAVDDLDALPEEE